MSKTTFDGRRAGALLAVSVLAAGCGPFDRDLGEADTVAAVTASTSAHPSFLYGRITTPEGDTYHGRLRFGGDEEAFWDHWFNGVKDGNPWVAHLPGGGPREWDSVELLGFEIGWRQPRRDLGRPFMVRFGDIATLEAKGRDLRVTLKSGTVVELARYAADDYADGVTVWDERRGLVELDEGDVRTIEFLPAAAGAHAAPHRLYGTVHTRQDRFTGFLQWDRELSVGLDEIEGYGPDGERVEVPFVAIRSIARRSPGSARVTLLDGTELVLSGSRRVGEGNRGVYVEDPRYGRVLVSWGAFERVDLGEAAGSGPAYDDFPAGTPLTGTVTTRDGRRLSGRLVYDLDESEVVETLDAPSGGVDYTIPFALVASIALPGHDDRARVTLHTGEELLLERAGDLADRNAGLLVFVDGRERPEYVAWTEVERIDLR